MTLNYKIITEVLQLEKAGFNNLEIASQLGFDALELIEHDVSTIDTIDDLVEEGITNSAEIAAKLNLPILYIEKLSLEYDLPVTLKKENITELIKYIRLDRKKEGRGGKKYKTHKQPKTQVKKIEHIEKIDKFIMEGADFSVMESASGLESKEIRTYLKATNQYELWLSQFRERTGREPSLREKQQRIKTGQRGRPKTGPTRLPEVDVLINERATIDEMKKVAGWLSCAAARDYMKRTNQYKKWKATKKSEEQQRKVLIGNIIKTAKQHSYNKSDRIEQKTFEFFTNTSKSKITYDTIKIIYIRYFEAKGQGKKLSLAKLGKGTGLYNSEIGKILSKTGLEPLYGKKVRHMTSQWKKDAIKRAFPLDVNPPDIAYFLELPEHIIYQSMKMIGPRPKRQEFIAKPLANTGLPDLTYRLASQIYEAKDLKFKTQEIAELLNTKKIIVDHMLKNETIISLKILDILKTLYPEKNITTPYIQTKQNN